MSGQLHCDRLVPRRQGERAMPIILWLLGVPLSVILLLMLFGVVGF
ncbi:hypothetical protein [Stella sp.]